MTIDITIGKLKIRSFEEVMKEKIEEYNFTYNDQLLTIDFLEVEQCPDEPDGCTEEDTMCPGCAYRSGSIWGMGDFFRIVLGDLAKEIRPISSNDRQITRIKPYLKDINKIEYSGNSDMHKMRLHWLKFWCNRAVKLYGDEAVIMFT